jgi:hypothetical protein
LQTLRQNLALNENIGRKKAELNKTKIKNKNKVNNRIKIIRET